MSLLHNFRLLFRNKTHFSPCLQFIRNIPQRYYSTEDDIDPIPEGMRTKATALSQDLPSTLLVKSYNEMGFTFSGGIQVFGPCVVFPKSVLHWSVRDAADINEDSLSLFTLLEPKLDILVIGVGDKKAMSKINPEAIVALRKLRINLEILTTDQALQTFNFLNSENRYIGGAFIPALVEKQKLDQDNLLKPFGDTDPLQVAEDFWRLPEDNEEPLLHRLPRGLLKSVPEKDKEDVFEKGIQEIIRDSQSTPKKKK